MIPAAVIQTVKCFCSSLNPFWGSVSFSVSKVWRWTPASSCLCCLTALKSQALVWGTGPRTCSRRATFPSCCSFTLGCGHSQSLRTQASFLRFFPNDPSPQQCWCFLRSTGQCRQLSHIRIRKGGHTAHSAFCTFSKGVYVLKKSTGCLHWRRYCKQMSTD